MNGENNLAKLKSAYQAWHQSKGSDSKVWLDLMSDQVKLRSMAHAAPALAFAQHRQSKAEAVAYFTALAKEWSMVHWTPETFVSEGDRIAMFGSCAWTNKATGKIAEISIGHLWQFENGKVVSVTEIFDSARALAASAP